MKPYEEIDCQHIDLDEGAVGKQKCAGAMKAVGFRVKPNRYVSKSYSANKRKGERYSDNVPAAAAQVRQKEGVSPLAKSECCVIMRKRRW